MTTMVRTSNSIMHTSVVHTYMVNKDVVGHKKTYCWRITDAFVVLHL